MDNSILKKKLSTYKSEKGYLKNLPDELLIEILVAWEESPSTAKDFYKSLGSSQRQMAGIIGRAKKLKRDGVVPLSNFNEIKVENNPNQNNLSSIPPIILKWKTKNIIRFYNVDHLIDFLNKAS